MQVEIIEIKSNKVAASVPIVLEGMSRIPSEPEFFAQAWRTAVEEKSVDPERRDDYRFRLLR